MDFDSEINRILNENYFGGSPHEQASGIKRHVTFEETDEEKAFKDAQAAAAREEQEDPDIEQDETEGEYAEVLRQELGSIEPFYAFSGDDHVTNRQSQLQQDEFIQQFLGEQILVNVGIKTSLMSERYDLHTYVLKDKYVADQMLPYGVKAYSEDDLGDETELGDLVEYELNPKTGEEIPRSVSRFKNIIIGKIAKDKQGNLQYDKRGVPYINKADFIYDGPFRDPQHKEWSGKEPETKAPVTGDTKIDYDADKKAVQNAIAQGLMRK